MKPPSLYAMAGITLILSACAGSDFVRPGDDRLIVGSTTMREAVALLGEPGQKSYQFANDRVIEVLHYVYAGAGGVTSVRSLNLLFHEEVLVGRRFVSSFKTDSTRFDTSLAAKIAPGMAEREVIALLGSPSGLYAYPKIADRSDRALVYGYPEKLGPNILIVELNTTGAVLRSYRDRFVSYATAQLASEYGPRQKLAAQRFAAGWPKLRKGMSASEVHELLGPSCGLHDSTIGGAERSLDGATYAGSLDFAPHLPSDAMRSYLRMECTLVFGRGRLSAWTLSQ